MAHLRPPVIAAPEIDPSTVALVVGIEESPTSKFPDIENLLIQEVASDLRATASFAEVQPVAELSRSPDLLASFLERKHGDPSSWCYLGESMMLSLLTAGVVPGCQCFFGYRLRFRRPGDLNGMNFDFSYETCEVFGWVALPLLVHPRWHWRNQPDDHVAYLKKDLQNVSSQLVELAKPTP
jgi:hypothetical protein